MVELPDEAAVVVLVAGIGPRPPQDRPPERPLEVLDRLHRDRVDHLLVELRIALGRAPSRPARAGAGRRGPPASYAVPAASTSSTLEVLADAVLAQSAPSGTRSVTSLIAAVREPRREARIHRVDAQPAVRRDRAAPAGASHAGEHVRHDRPCGCRCAAPACPRTDGIARRDVPAQRARGPSSSMTPSITLRVGLAVEPRRSLGVGDELLQLLVDQPALRELEVEHLARAAAARRCPRPVRTRRNANESLSDSALFGRSRTGRTSSASRGLQDAVAEVLRGRPSRAESNSALRTASTRRQSRGSIVLVLLEPERGRGGDLRRGGRRAFAVQPDDRRRTRSAPTECSACRRRSPPPWRRRDRSCPPCERPVEVRVRRAVGHRRRSTAITRGSAPDRPACAAAARRRGCRPRRRCTTPAS